MNFPAPKASVMYHANPQSTDLLVAFSGRRMGLVIDSFSFSKSSRDVPVNRLMLRDNFGLWYHGGLQGHTVGIADTAQRLKQLIRSRGIKRICVLGVSSGGYAALLFGQMLGANTICSISPRTRLIPDAQSFVDRNRHGVQDSLMQLQGQPNREDRYFDLATYLGKNPIAATRAQVHYDPDHPLDRFHAEHIADVPSLTLQQHPGAGHLLASHMASKPQFFQSLLAPH